mmetsp:Transcript_30942/g.34511  ORF Transcript_30942/g.34511 Transcript_30942/m.34511 type:complete len:443 (+) Transcript_30942:44-1372(+)
MGYSMSVVTVLWLCCLFSMSESVKIGIVGAGMGGATTAYYLREFCNAAPLDIHVFEKSGRVGGRLKHIEIEDIVVEVGGDAWATENYYLREIAAKLNIQYDNSTFNGNGIVGVWGGPGTPLKNVSEEISLSSIALLTAVEMFRRAIHLNYDDRTHQAAFTSIESFLKVASLTDFSSVSVDDYLKNLGAKESFIAETVEPIIRTIYDQEDTVQAFAGLVSVLPTFSDAYTAYGGNDAFVNEILEFSKVKPTLNATVEAISRVGNLYDIELASGDYQKDFDAVILAVPIEFANLTFEGFKVPKITPRSYKHWYVTVIGASGLNPKYFGVQEVPDDILTLRNSKAPFHVLTGLATTKSGLNIYKTFSNEPISDDVLDQIYLDRSFSYIQHWPYTFPDMSPTEIYQDIIIDDGLLYLNAIENIATAMEASTIAGRNAAKMIAEKMC